MFDAVRTLSARAFGHNDTKPAQFTACEIFVNANKIVFR